MESRCSATGSRPRVLPLSRWITELQDRDLCLTVGDIVELKKNKEMKVLVLSRGAVRLASRYAGYSPMEPSSFFRSSYWFDFRKGEGLTGWARFMCDFRFRRFEFHVELQPGVWSRIGTSKRLSELPRAARVGWLGCSAKWESLQDMPEVCYC